MSTPISHVHRRQNVRRALLLVSFLLGGCHESGTWKDDARNWKLISQTRVVCLEAPHSVRGVGLLQCSG